MSSPTPAEGDSNTRLASTTFEWKRVRMRRPAEGHSNSPPKAGRSYFRRLSPWDWRRKPLTITVKYRGGAQCWFELKARGGTLRVEGAHALVDVVAELANQHP